MQRVNWYLINKMYRKTLEIVLFIFRSTSTFVPSYPEVSLSIFKVVILKYSSTTNPYAFLLYPITVTHTVRRCVLLGCGVSRRRALLGRKRPKA
jgi:hypothetical protein